MSQPQRPLLPLTADGRLELGDDAGEPLGDRVVASRMKTVTSPTLSPTSARKTTTWTGSSGGSPPDCAPAWAIATTATPMYTHAPRSAEYASM